MKKSFQIQLFPTDIDNLKDVRKNTDMNIFLNRTLETLLYGREEEGKQIIVKSIMPLYDDGYFTNLLVLYEEETQIGVIFNDSEEVEFFPKDYIQTFKENNKIIRNDIEYKIKSIKYDLDYNYLLLNIELGKI